MRPRRPSHRLIKIHRNYTVEEVATLLGVHRNTVRTWIKLGLPIIDARRPVLILGSQLLTFHRQRQAKKKRPCAPSEIYCVRCRAPQTPAGREVFLELLTPTSGTLMGICPSCNSWMYRRTSLTKLSAIQGELTVTNTEGKEHISESSHSFPNSDFRKDPGNHGNAPP